MGDLKPDPFREAKDLAAGNIRSIVKKLLPNAQMIGSSYRIGSVDGSKGESLSIDPKTGLWYDFANPSDSGDIISLWARVKGVTPREAASQIISEYGGEARRERVTPVNVPEVVIGRPTKVYRYLSLTDEEVSSLTRMYLQFCPENDVDFDACPPAASASGIDPRCILEVHRWDRPGQPKKILPYDPATGRHVMPHRDGRRPIYNRHLISWPIMGRSGTVYGSYADFRYYGLDGHVVIVTEGEKAADAVMASTGGEIETYDATGAIVSSRLLVATTSPSGSSQAAMADWSPLRGLDVIIWPDNDEAGKRYAADVVAQLQLIGPKSIKVIKPRSEWPEKADAADFPPDVISGVLMDAVRGAGVETVPCPGATIRRIGACFAGGRLSSVEWIVDGIVPRGDVTIVAAPGGVGKSTLLASLTAWIAASRTGDDDCVGVTGYSEILGRGLAGGGVLYCPGEESADAIMLRIRDAARGVYDGALIERPNSISVVRFDNPEARGIISIGPDGVPAEGPLLGLIEAELVSIWRPAMVIIDPLSSFVPPGADMNSSAVAAHVIEVLRGFARRHNIAVVLSHHARKPASGGEPETSQAVVRGSSALVDGARSVIVMVRKHLSEEEASEYSMALRFGVSFVTEIIHAKSNLAPIEKEKIARVVLSPGGKLVRAPEPIPPTVVKRTTGH